MIAGPERGGGHAPRPMRAVWSCPRQPRVCPPRVRFWCTGFSSTGAGACCTLAGLVWAIRLAGRLVGVGRWGAAQWRCRAGTAALAVWRACARQGSAGIDLADRESAPSPFHSGQCFNRQHRGVAMVYSGLAAFDLVGGWVRFPVCFAGFRGFIGLADGRAVVWTPGGGDCAG